MLDGHPTVRVVTDPRQGPKSRPGAPELAAFPREPFTPRPSAASRSPQVPRRHQGAPAIAGHNPITRCRAPHDAAMSGPDDDQGTNQTLTEQRLTLMVGHPVHAGIFEGVR